MELKGEVKSVIFRSEDTGYTVLDLRVEDYVYTVVGIFPPVCEGQNVRVEGKFQNKTMYGKQFFADNVYVTAPSRIEGMKRFLSSGLIRGLGPITAEAIIDKFGINSLEMMKYPLELAKVRGISLKKAIEFGMNYNSLIKMQGAVIFLQELGITINLALKIYRIYEDKTEDNIRKNPYMLVDDVDGIGFQTADRIAQELGIDRQSDYRISAGIIYTLKDAAAKNGHNYLPENELLSATNELLRLDCDNAIERIQDNISDLVMLGDLVRYQTKDHVAIVLKMNYNTEKNIAKNLVALQFQSVDYRVDVDYEVKRFEAEAGFELHEKQIAAVKAAVENGVQIVTGGPGTGKTTIIKCILHLFNDLGRKVALCAPTGRAAKRLSEATGQTAKTIHRLLGLDYKDGDGYYKYNENCKLDCDVIIVDEVSMMDEYVFNALLKALAKGTRLVLVGDKDQLASVGTGNVLSDLIASKRFPINYLTQIYRQSEKSKIIPNAHKINNGEMPDLDNKSDDFFFEEKTDAMSIAYTTKDLVTKRLPKYLNVNPIDIQVLCPMKRGVAGIVNLNRELQAVINPPAFGKAELKYGEVTYRVGDKVMQMQNDYQQEWTVTTGDKVEKGLGVFNGDVGTIIDINPRIMQFTVHFDDDKVAIYQYSAIEELSLAYAVTIHKSQGSEFDAVVIALDANYMLLSRNLLYTAVTRAKKLVVVVGSKQTVAMMIKNNETTKRYSLLVDLIEENFGAY